MPLVFKLSVGINVHKNTAIKQPIEINVIFNIFFFFFIVNLS